MWERDEPLAERFFRLASRDSSLLRSPSDTASRIFLARGLQLLLQCFFEVTPMKYAKLCLAALAAQVVTACSFVPVPGGVTPVVVQGEQVVVPGGSPAAVVAPCSTCGPKPFVAIAVTRPPACNDYPVTYRVQVPEADDRIRMIDRSELVSSAAMAYQVPACQR